MTDDEQVAAAIRAITFTLTGTIDPAASMDNLARAAKAVLDSIVLGHVPGVLYMRIHP